MLYVTTRSNSEPQTAYHALRESRGADGGLYIPYQFSGFSSEMLESAPEKTFGQNIADVLNLFFSAHLTGWDVDFCIGRFPVRLTPLHHRIIMAESWHNPQWTFERMVKNLSRHLLEGQAAVTGGWTEIAVRIAVFYSIFAQLRKEGIQEADISVLSGNFSAPISAWYARAFGLPIRNIICCCNENNSLWDLICQGHMRMDGISIPTILPEADIAVPKELERLVFHCGGREELKRYLQCVRIGSTYLPSDAVLNSLRKGLYVSVVSSSRIKTTIPSVLRSHEYLHSSSGALSYAGLLDYRAKTGKTRHALVLSEKSPVCDAKLIADSLGIPEEELLQKL